MAGNSLRTGCCIVGGGPAGIMLGYLLARTGVQVAVLEKHGDFFRDFRGDTVHPSTLEVLYELALLEDFLNIPHQELRSVSGVYGDFRFKAADFRYVPGHSKFVAFMPQWDFLRFLSDRAKMLPSFDLRMHHEAVGLIREGDRISGVVARTPNGEVSVRADLVVGCDGRQATTRSAAGLQVIETGVPIDVLWFRILRQPGDPEQLLGTVNYGKALILINRNEYFQAGMIIRKGSFEEVQRHGFDSFRQSILQLAPYLDGRVDELRDWEQVKLLTVQINRLRRWHRPGLLCIGDAAHAMSPAGGVGINLAIQDAVAAANLLALPLLQGTVDEEVLAAVQKRREFPARVTQAVQVQVHKAFAYAFENPGPLKAPQALRIAVQVPGVHALLGYAVGVGVRPEHVRSAAGRAPGERRSTAVAVGAALGTAAGTIVCWLRSFARLAPVASCSAARPAPRSTQYS